MNPETNPEEYRINLLTNRREYNEATCQLNLLIRQKRLSLREIGPREWSIEEDDSIRQEVEGTGEIGVLSRAIEELDRRRSDIDASRLRAGLAAYGRRLTATGLADALCTTLYAYRKSMGAEDVQEVLAFAGFDMRTLENAPTAIARTLGELRNAGRVQHSPETDSYRLTLNESLRQWEGANA